LFGMSFLEQAPCFTTDKHFFAMNPQWHHVLRRRNSQDLRKIKFTKKTCLGESYNFMNIQMYMNGHERRTFRQNSALNINLRWAFFAAEDWSPALLSSLLSLEPSSSESLDSSSLVEDSGDVAPFPRFSSSNN
jgi:hypothetical protein